MSTAIEIHKSASVPDAYLLRCKVPCMWAKIPANMPFDELIDLILAVDAGLDITNTVRPINKSTADKLFGDTIVILTMSEPALDFLSLARAQKIRSQP